MSFLFYATHWLIITMSLPKMSFMKKKRNKRPMVHIAHLRNQFKLINTFTRDMIIPQWSKEEKDIYLSRSPFWKLNRPYLFKVKFPTSKVTLCQVWLKLDQWVLRRRLLNFVNVFLLLRYYLFLKKGMALHLYKLESPLPKDALWQV